MAEHDNGELRPVPDPTVRTTEQIERFIGAERDYVDGQVGITRERLAGEARALEQRLAAMDKATELLSETVNRVPTEVTKEVTHLAGLVDEQLKSIATQFAERDTRSERESRDNKVAVDAAFAAQKEAAAKQDESNAKAIDKSEAATTETINKLSELFKSSTDALGDKIDDLKQRVQAIESGGVGRGEANSDARAGQQLGVARSAFIASLVFGAVVSLGVIATIVALILR